MQFGQLKRRELIALPGGAAAWPEAAWAQQAERMRHIGLLAGAREGDPATITNLAALREGLKTLGWEVGRNPTIEYRFAAGNRELYRTYATELVGLSPDIILTNTPALAALQRTTDTIPIVFITISDPVSAGFVPRIPMGRRKLRPVA